MNSRYASTPPDFIFPMNSYTYEYSNALIEELLYLRVTSEVISDLIIENEGGYTIVDLSICFGGV